MPVVQVADGVRGAFELAGSVPTKHRKAFHEPLRLSRINGNCLHDSEFSRGSDLRVRPSARPGHHPPPSRWLSAPGPWTSAAFHRVVEMSTVALRTFMCRTSCS